MLDFAPVILYSGYRHFDLAPSPSASVPFCLCVSHHREHGYTEFKEKK